MSTFEPEIEVAIARVRSDVSRLHVQLTRNGLVAWTGGNLSGRVPGADLFVIKPGGVEYGELAPEKMILCTLDGRPVAGTPGCERSPSSDAAAHAYVYRHMPEIGGVVHTHSTYATAWAARGEAVPCTLAATAYEFGGDIPAGPFATPADDSIGRGIVQTLAGHRSKAVLMQNRGPFVLVRRPRDAVRGAVMVEDAARSAHLARAGGRTTRMAQNVIDTLFSRNQHAVGPMHGRAQP